MIFSLNSINLRLGKSGNEPWVELLRHLLKTGVGLFVGLSEVSFRDRALAPLLADVGEELCQARPTGFWILCGEVSEATKNEFLGVNVVPVSRAGFGDIPEFISRICQKAALTV